MHRQWVGLEKWQAGFERCETIIDIVEGGNVEREFAVRVYTIAEFVGVQNFGLWIRRPNHRNDKRHTAGPGKCPVVSTNAMLGKRGRSDCTRGCGPDCLPAA